ncbi:MAG: cytochrome P450 [Polyangiaceae bacterium]
MPGAMRDPPQVPGALPLIGHMVPFGKNPFEFMRRVRADFGDIAEFRMFHQRMVLLTGDEASELFFRGTDAELDQSAAYKLMTPIFGKGVVFDAPQERKDQQLRMLMPALRDKSMRSYAGKIVGEVEGLLEPLKDAAVVDLTEFTKELTIYTSSHCLLGPEFRYELTKEFAQIYHDLEAGVQPIAYIHPFLPLPAFKRRDRARKRLEDQVTRIIAKREKQATKSTDMFQSLIDSRYKDGSRPTPYEITGMLVGAMFAGHHTSSGTTAWVVLELLKRPELLKRVRTEVDAAYASDGEISFESLRHLPLLDSVLREVLRLHPPLIILIRKVLEDLTFRDYHIPAGKYVCVAPPVTHRIPELFPNPEAFDPDRYSAERGEDKNLNAYQPFGGGKHKCSGNAFAQFQIKTIIAALIRRMDLELVDPESYYYDDYTQMIVQPKSPCRVRFRRRPEASIPAAATRIRAEQADKGCPFSPPQTEKPRWRLEIDGQLCQGHAVCMGEAPELFFVGDGNDALGEVKVAHPTEAQLTAARKAARLCPNSAIRIIDNRDDAAAAAAEPVRAKT